MLYVAAALTIFLGEAAAQGSTCRQIRQAYQDSSCCGNNLAQTTDFLVSPPPPPVMGGSPNHCAGAKPYDAFTPGDGYFRNTNCTLANGVLNALEQAGANVTRGYVGGIDASSRQPINRTYFEEGMCPVNVHWHLGTEHLSVGEFDENGSGPGGGAGSMGAGRRLSGSVRQGFQCHHYDAHQSMYTTPYNWQFCTNMEVGQTYEVHWPHSAAGACHTPWQYQSPFYDGVFCTPGIISLSPLNTFRKIGVQAQIFTIVNNESYYNPDLIRGAVVDGEMWQDVAKYTGSTTGTSRNNEICSRYTPITWQVDRKCHLISASSFDKLCKDMGMQKDDMSGDFYAHGARELVATHLVANNQQSRK